MSPVARASIVHVRCGSLFDFPRAHFESEPRSYIVSHDHTCQSRLTYLGSKGRRGRVVDFDIDWYTYIYRGPKLKNGVSARSDHPFSRYYHLTVFYLGSRLGAGSNLWCKFD